MELHFNVSGEARKKLVDAISKDLGIKATYLRVPTCAYQIGAYHVSKEGTLTFPDETDLNESSKVIDACVMAGFEPAEWVENAETGDALETAEGTADEGTQGAETPDTADTADTGLTIELPLECTAVGNLTLLLEAKGNLIMEALGISSLPIEIRETTVAFPWFTKMPEPDEVTAYTELISAIAKMAKEASRVTAKKTEVDNPKYAFRCFLLRLGFIGNEYKQIRKVLLNKLSGSAAFKTVKKGGEQ